MSPTLDELCGGKRLVRGTVFILHQEGADFLTERGQFNPPLRGGESLIYPELSYVDMRNREKFWLQREDGSWGVYVGLYQDLFCSAIEPPDAADLRVRRKR